MILVPTLWSNAIMAGRWDNKNLQDLVERDKLLRQYDKKKGEPYTPDKDMKPNNGGGPPIPDMPESEGVKVDMQYKAETDEHIVRVSKDGENIQQKVPRDMMNDKMLMDIMLRALIQTLLRRIKDKQKKPKQEKRPEEEKKPEPPKKQDGNWIEKLKADLTKIFVDGGIAT